MSKELLLELRYWIHIVSQTLYLHDDISSFEKQAIHDSGIRVIELVDYEIEYKKG